jgi:hypothetical protein
MDCVMGERTAALWAWMKAVRLGYAMVDLKADQKAL